MPHFFFRALDDSPPQDRIGVSLPTLQAAYLYAVNYAGARVAARSELPLDGEPVHVEVTDVEGQPLFVVTTCAMEARNLVLS